LPKAQRLLSNLASLPDGGDRLLLASISETLHHGSKRQGAILLQRIMDKYNYNPPREVDTCALLRYVSLNSIYSSDLRRCTVRLLVAVLEEELKTDEEMLCRLCAAFKAGEEILCQRSSIKL